MERVSVAMPVLFILLLRPGCVASHPHIATPLTGVMCIASNAVGLTGLARRGIVNTGNYGTGSATRLATGKSPQELQHAVNSGVVKTGEAIRRTPASALNTVKSFRAS